MRRANRKVFAMQHVASSAARAFREALGFLMFARAHAPAATPKTKTTKTV
jgi:hypothetical protein